MTRYLTNPLFLFVTVWTIAGASYLLGIAFGVFPDVQPVAAAIVLLNVLTFCLGYLTWTLFQHLTPPMAKPAVVRTRPLSTDRIAAALKFTLCMGLIALSLGLYRIAMVASYSGSSFLELLTHPGTLRLQLVLFIGANVFEVNHITMLISATSSFFSIGFVLLGIFLSVSNSTVRYFYLCGFLLVSLAIGLTNLSRFEVTVHILYIIFAYCFSCSWRNDKGSRPALVNILIPLTAAVVLFVAIELLLRKGSYFAQPDRLRGFLFSLYWYVASPLAAFNEFLSSFDGHYRLGQNMFFPFYKWLCRFGLARETNISVYGEMIFVPYAANVYTYLRSLYEDFGMVGVAVAPYALGWILALVKAGASRYFHFLNVYVILLVFVTFSFYNYSLISNQIYLQMLFGLVFFRYELTSPD